MKRSAIAVAIIAIAASAAAGTAEAAPKKKAPPPCRTITDAEGDSKYGKGLDILSADIASNTRTVTAVFRLPEITKSNSSAPTGQGYYFDFSAGGETPIYLSYTVTPTTESFNYGWVDGSIHRSLGAATGVVDTAKKEIRVSAPVSAWGAYGTPRVGSKLTGIELTSYWVIGAYAPPTPVTNTTGGGSLQTADQAIGKTYVAGSPSCVVPGK